MQCWLYNNCNHIHCEDAYCPRAFKLDALYNSAGFEMVQRSHPNFVVDDCDLDKFKQLNDIRKNILNFVNTGSNLFIHSHICGNGKTSWALTLVQAYFDKIWRTASLDCHALFINVPRYLAALKDSINYGPSEYIKLIKTNLASADIVIWDDIATKAASDYDIEQLLSAIDARYSMGKANIFTSNLNIEEMKHTVGLRLASRISSSIDIEFKGIDKRSLMKGTN